MEYIHIVHVDNRIDHIWVFKSRIYAKYVC
jgi:hypothetical protein